MEELYEMILKRKSFRRFDETLSISSDEMQKIEQQLNQLLPLQNNIRIEFRIVEKSKTTCKRGEYCLLIYSQQKELFLINAGYMLEQMDLFLASIDIGVCWYGFGKADIMQRNGLDFIIMLALGKSRPEDFRKDITKSRRKPSEAIWNGAFDEDIVRLIRYAPSSCNMQPWRVVSAKNEIKIYRTTEVNSIMPVNKRPFYNSIDMGVFLCFLEILLMHSHYRYNRILHDKGNEEQISNEGYMEIATYTIE